MVYGGPRPARPGLLCGAPSRGCRQAPSHKIFPESFTQQPIPPERTEGPIFGRDPISIVTPVPKNFPGEISEKSNPLGIVKLVKGRVL